MYIATGQPASSHLPFVERSFCQANSRYLWLISRHFNFRAYHSPMKSRHANYFANTKLVIKCENFAPGILREVRQLWLCGTKVCLYTSQHCMGMAVAYSICCRHHHDLLEHITYLWYWDTLAGEWDTICAFMVAIHLSLKPFSLRKGENDFSRISRVIIASHKTAFAV